MIDTDATSKTEECDGALEMLGAETCAFGYLTPNELMAVFSNTISADFSALQGPVNGIFGLMIVLGRRPDRNPVGPVVQSRGPGVRLGHPTPRAVLDRESNFKLPQA